jgi:hypothetical protein
VPLAIEHSLNQAFATELQEKIFANLDFSSEDAPERLKHLLGEDQAVTARRSALEDRKRRLYDIQRKLNAFQL